MNEIKGLAQAYPLLSGLFILSAFASLGLPGLAHFPAEFQLFIGGFRIVPVATAILLIGLIITAALYLRAIQKVFLGKKEQSSLIKPDLNTRELWAIIPLSLIIILIGIYPELLLSIIHATAKMIGS